MAFKMRSGNKVSFKNMGSSPVKQKENLPRDPGDRGTEVKWDNVRQEYIPINTPNAKSPSTPQPTGPKPISPTKQKLNKGGEGQDQDKIFNNKGEHIGDYVNDKPVMRPGFKRPVVKKDAPVKPKEGDMRKYSDLEKYDDDRPVVKKDKPVKPTDKDMYKYSDLEKYDDDNPTGKAEPPKKKKSPAKQAVELESDSANPGGVHAGESLLGKKRRKEKSQKNAVERSKGETALQGEATKQAELSARERKADKS